MAKLLFHSLVGSENPTRACFTFLQAVANKERGDEVEIALGGPLTAVYFMPMIVDLASDGTLEAILQGGLLPMTVLNHGLETLYEGEDDRPFPYGALADCPGVGKSLVEGSATHPSRLKLISLEAGTLGQT
ncbi:MAG: hypothetical protein HYU88_07510, partial [Chloroflexi bacterium]|nr:hypothetical protein [Chloroflexota bacterium]